MRESAMSPDGEEFDRGTPNILTEDGAARARQELAEHSTRLVPYGVLSRPPQPRRGSA
jgi:hypothetical protein